MEAADLIGLGDDPALEFVNTTAALPDGGVLELIGDGRAYVAWLERVGMLDSSDRTTIEESFGPAEVDAVAEEARKVREWLRPVISGWSSEPDRPLPADVADRLNTILAGDERFSQIQADLGGALVRRHRHWTRPEQLLIPPMEAAATLLTTGDQGLVRKCEGCSMWFYDHTKAHRRRWCSMAMCGNRAKVRTHRERSAVAKAEPSSGEGVRKA